MLIKYNKDLQDITLKTNKSTLPRELKNFAYVIALFGGSAIVLFLILTGIEKALGI